MFMKARWVKLVLALGLLLVGGVFIGLYVRPGEPRHGWRPLSYWLEQSVPPEVRASSTWLETRRPCPEHVQVAFQHMSPKSIPVLFQRLTNVSFYSKAYEKLPYLIQARLHPPKYTDYLLRNRIVHALSYSGSTAVPQLIPILSDPSGDARQVAVRALAFIGAEAAPAVLELTKLLQDPDGEVRSAALTALTQMGPNKRQAIPDVIKTLQDDKRRDLWEGAAAVLGSLGSEAVVAVPELNRVLNDPEAGARAREQAAVALCRIQNAPEGMAFLIARLEDCRKFWSKNPDAGPRWSLDRTGVAFDEDPLPPGVIPLFPEEEAEPLPDARNIFRAGIAADATDFPSALRILKSLGELGLSAKPAAPLIRNLIENPGFWPGLEMLRPQLVQAASEALARIDPAAAAKANSTLK